MEQKHARRIRQDFPQESRNTTIFVLDIPDDYDFMDPELQQILKDSVPALLSGVLE